MINENVSLTETQVLEWAHQTIEGHNPLAQLPENKLQEIYALAFVLYRNQRYQEANCYFRILVMNKPNEAKYWKSLGSCLQMLKDYEAALNCYTSVHMLQNQSDPYLYVYIADCYFALKQKEKGLSALEKAHVIAKKSNHEQVLQHVKLMRDLWSKS